MVDISLVIINDNAEEYCSALFKSIQEQITPGELDLVFVDNCSKDQSVQKAKEFGIRKIYVFDTKQDSKGVLYNKGFGLTERSNIIFAHSDILFGECFFDKLVSKIKSRETKAFNSFSEYAPSMVYWGTNAIGIDKTGNNLFIREHFTEPPKNIDWLLECSAACFMVDREFMKKADFDEQYKNSFIEHTLLLDVLNKEGHPMVLGDCYFVHYSIELHEKMKTYNNDLQIFVISLIKHYRFSADRLYEYLVRSNNQIDSLNMEINGLNAQVNGLTNQITELNAQIKHLLLQLKEMPIAVFFLKARRKLKRKIKSVIQRKGL